VRQLRARSTRWTVGALAALGAGTAASADLLDLYDLAESSDPTYQSARFALEAARQKRPEALSALLPALSANGSANRTSGRTSYTGVSEVQRTFSGDQWQLQLTQPLLRADGVWALDEARAQGEQSVAQYAAAKQDLILRLARAYFDVVVAQRHGVAAQAQLDAMGEQLQAARHSFDAGVASITDVDDSRSRAALAEAQKVAAINERDAARATLEAIVGDVNTPLSPLQEAVPMPRPAPEDIGAWVQRAVDANPNVRGAQAVLNVADYEIKRTRALRAPTVDLIASYGSNYASGNITEPVDFGSNVRDTQISVQFTVPLFDGGGLHAQVAEALAKRAKAQADLNSAQRQSSVDAKQAYAAVLSGVSQVQALEAAVAAGKSAVKGNRIGYGLGIRINSDVLNAEQQLYGTEHDLEKARYDTIYEGLKLKAAAGELTEADVAAVNRLLLPDAPGNASRPATHPDARSALP
jgi:outer membrane protein